MKKNFIFIASYFIFLIAFSFNNFQEREFDWDLPGYLGAIFKVELNNKKFIHEKVYGVLKQESPTESYRNMTENSGYRKEMSVDGEDFYRQIPYYSIKVLYVFLIFLFYKIGFSATASVILPNVISFFLVGILLFKVFNKIFVGNSYLSIIFSVLVLLFPPFQKMSEIASPDMLAVLAVLWFFWNYINKEKTFVLFLNLLLLTAVRPDFAVFAISFYFFDLLLGKYSKKRIFEISAYVFFTIVFYQIILKINEYPGWKAVFYDTFIHRRIDLAKESFDFSLQEYFRVVKENIIHFKKIFFGGLLLVVVMFYYARKMKLEYFAFGLFIFFNMVIKFLIFPNPSDLRFYFPFLLVLFLWNFKVFNDRKQEQN